MASVLLGDYIPECELYDLFVMYDSELKVSDLSVGTRCRL